MFVFSIPLAWAASQTEEPLATDRPDFTESSSLVAKGRLQVETGATWARQESDRSLNLPEALIRYGLDDRIELRATLPDWNEVESDDVRNRGWSSPTLGAKGPISLGDKVEGAWIATVSLPRGSSAFRDSRSVPDIKLCFSTEIDENWTAAWMLAGTWPEGGPVGLATLSFARGLPNDFGAFFEAAATWQDGQRPVYVLHTGIVKLCGPNRQWDLHVGAEPERLSRSSFFGIGYSFRL